jgi:hypothetical protein
MTDQATQQGAAAADATTGNLNPNPADPHGGIHQKDYQAHLQQQAAEQQQQQAPPADKPDVVASAESLHEHIDDTKDDVADAEKEVLEKVPTEHHNAIREAFGKLHSAFSNLVRHSAWHLDQSKKAAQAGQPLGPGDAVYYAAPRSTATSDAHRNTGNGGAVTGNPRASFAQASAAQVAVEQGAKIPGVATEPQPDAAVR